MLNKYPNMCMVIDYVLCELNISNGTLITTLGFDLDPNGIIEIGHDPDFSDGTTTFLIYYEDGSEVEEKLSINTAFNNLIQLIEDNNLIRKLTKSIDLDTDEFIKVIEEL